ncbi:MAG: HipA domain-containing protein [Janthinobacterium lividum]
MSLALKVWDAERLIGELTHDAQFNRYTFIYANSWITADNSYSLCPRLPLDNAGLSPERHSADARNFFQNLLPEGRALDDAAATYSISKGNLAGLLHALGRESAGALMFTSGATAPQGSAHFRLPRSLPPAELSQRIRNRPAHPFTLWDGRLRLSIAGYQDKLAVLQSHGQWFLPETAQQSSTHIIKPEPVNPNLTGMTTNELMCMLLAKAVRIPVAHVRLDHVPEPVLVIERFDRLVTHEGNDADAGDMVVQRLPCIDGCQALGLPVEYKYERLYGDGPDVKDIREGASLPQFFKLLDDKQQVRATATARLEFLRWVIFQVLIGNTDAHAKNLSFFSDSQRLALAPAYDLVCGLAMRDANIADNLAMAVGDNFDPRTIRAYDWALMAHECAIAPRLLVNAVKTLATQAMNVLPDIKAEALIQGGSLAMVERVAAVVRSQCKAALACVGEILAIRSDSF